MSRRALVTGAAGGIGGRVVRDLLARGWRVAALDRVAADWTDLPADQRGRLLRLRADLTADPEVDACAAEVAGAWQGLDALVNNAAVGPPRRPLAAQTAAGTADLLEVNVVGQLRAVQAVRELLAGGAAPAVVNVSSVGAARAFRGNPGYCASKGAVEALTRALALDLAPLGVRVNAVAPGMVRTSGWSAAEPAEQRRRAGLVPLGRPGEPDEVAAAVHFLAGPESSYITGTVLTVDGGLAVQAYPVGDEPGVAAPAPGGDG